MQCLWSHNNQGWSDHIKLLSDTQKCTEKVQLLFNVKVNLSTYGQLAVKL